MHLGLRLYRDIGNKQINACMRAAGSTASTIGYLAREYIGAMVKYTEVIKVLAVSAYDYTIVRGDLLRKYSGLEAIRL